MVVRRTTEPRVLEDRVERRASKVQTIELIPALSQTGDDTKGLSIPLKAIRIPADLSLLFISYQLVKAHLSDVAERWVAKIVGEGRCFAGVGIHACAMCFRLLRPGEVLSDPPRDLGDLERVGESIVVGVPLVRRDYLGDPAEPRKG